MKYVEYDEFVKLAHGNPTMREKFEAARKAAEGGGAEPSLTA